MGRLIDADKLKNHYSWWNNQEKELFDSIVDAQPTAYDVDEVVKEVKEISMKWLGEVRTCNVIKAIRKGGINEKANQ